MAQFQAYYSDGQSAQERSVDVRVVDGHLVFNCEQQQFCHDVKSCILSPKIGTTPQFIQLPCGGLLTSSEHSVLKQAFNKTPFVDSVSDRLEKHWRFALLSVIFSLFIVVNFVKYGIPYFADQAATLVSSQILDDASHASLQLLKDDLLTDSEITLERQQQIAELFYQLPAVEAHSNSYRLHFYKGNELKANAFALPSGDIVLTDELVTNMPSNMHILAILAHEVGHVEQKHGLRNFFRQAGLFIVFSVLLGDIGDISGSLTGLPMALLQLDFSREFEYEADQYSVEVLQARDLSPKLLIESFQRLEEIHLHDEGTHEQTDSKSAHSANALEIFMTHPLTENRIKNIERLAAESQP
ncbi:M48 family peptidase [Catenovulum agarivorans DS-2]|uniref:M48 family peptidase n=1 Tax=Catenovulum agarivorans DS-2 TaxID=1328313 RepID=W7QR94_9ALTE|nr:M48 family metallopeptidase [Catenovulum agarivorans]EWH11522.1 M48 family peptidase [Catenovulum agarivorans DS-2]